MANRRIFAVALTNDIRESVTTPTWTAENGVGSRAAWSGHALSDDDAWIGTQDNRVQHWNGSAWSETTLDAAGNIKGIFMLATDCVYAVADGGSLESGVWKYNGSTWTLIASRPTGVDLLGVWASDENNVWIVGNVDGDANHGRIYHFDGVSTFTQQVDSTVGGFRDAWGTSSSNVWAVGHRAATGAPVLWQYNGSSWSDYSSRITANSACNGIDGIDATTFWVTCRRADSSNQMRVWKTTNSGASFTIDYDDATTVTGGQAILALSATDVYSVGQGGRIAHYTGSWATETSGTSNVLYAVLGTDLDPPTATGESGPSFRPTKEIWQWSSQSVGPIANVESLSINGTVVLTNNVLDAGLVRGTVTANSSNGYDVKLTPLSDYYVGVHPIPWSIQVDNSIEATVTGEIEVKDLPNPGDGWLIKEQSPQVDYELTRLGHLVRDDTVSTRARLRLLTRRGEWFGDPDLGSRLHTIETLKNIDALIENFIREALQPMVDDGTVASVEIGQVETNYADGSAFVRCNVIAGDGQTVELGVVPLGQGSGISQVTAQQNRIERRTGEKSGGVHPSGAIGFGEIGVFLWGEAGELKSQGDGWLIDKDYQLTPRGHLERDSTIATRCMIRLMTRRGEWIGDKNLGSRLHELVILKDAETRAPSIVQQALQPMIDDGSILTVSSTILQKDHKSGSMLLAIDIELPDRSTLSITGIEIGESNGG